MLNAETITFLTNFNVSMTKGHALLTNDATWHTNFKIPLHGKAIELEIIMVSSTCNHLGVSFYYNILAYVFTLVLQC